MIKLWSEIISGSSTVCEGPYLLHNLNHFLLKTDCKISGWRFVKVWFFYAGFYCIYCIKIYHIVAWSMKILKWRLFATYTLPLPKGETKANWCGVLVQEPITFFGRSVAPPCENVIFAFERSYITSATRKSMLDVPVPGSFWNIGHRLWDLEGSDCIKPCDSNQVKIKEAQCKINLHRSIVHWMLIKNCQRTMVIWCFLTKLLQLKVPQKCWHKET